MTIAPLRNGPYAVDPQSIVVRRTAASGHGMTLAGAANSAALDTMPGRFLAVDLGTQVSPDVQSWSYTRTPSAAYLWIEWNFPGNVGAGGAAAVSLTILDNLGHTVGPTDARIPFGFKNETLAGTSLDPAIGNRDRFAYQSWGGRGVVDLTALATTLTGPDWTFRWTVSVSGTGYVQRIQAWEVPRFQVDDSEVAGVIPGSFFPLATITDHPTVSVPRILATLQAARTTQARLLTLAWTETTSGSAPTVTSTLDGPFGGMTEVGTTPMSFRVPVRQVVAASAAGEIVRWRVRYCTQTGTGLKVTLHTGSTTSSGAFLAGLADTAGAWAWSPWQGGAVASNGGTMPPEDTVSFTGFCSVAGHQAWLAAIEIEGNCA